MPRDAPSLAARLPAAARAGAFFGLDRRQPHGDDHGGPLERRRRGAFLLARSPPSTTFWDGGAGDMQQQLLHASLFARMPS